MKQTMYYTEGNTVRKMSAMPESMPDYRQDNTEPSETETYYILNVNSKKFHTADCQQGQNVKKENRENFCFGRTIPPTPILTIISEISRVLTEEDARFLMQFKKPLDVMSDLVPYNDSDENNIYTALEKMRNLDIYTQCRILWIGDRGGAGEQPGSRYGSA